MELRTNPSIEHKDTLKCKSGTLGRVRVCKSKDRVRCYRICPCHSADDTKFLMFLDCYYSQHVREQATRRVHWLMTAKHLNLSKDIAAYIGKFIWDPYGGPRFPDGRYTFLKQEKYKWKKKTKNVVMATRVKSKNISKDTNVYFMALVCASIIGAIIKQILLWGYYY